MAAARPVPPPPATPREAPKSVEESRIGDSLEAFGLKGEDLGALNGDKGTVMNILGWSNRRRYVMKFKPFVIDDNGDLAEKERLVTLTAENLRLPGTGGDTADGDEGEDADGDEDEQKSRSRSRRRRSRSRRRSRRSRSRRRHDI